MHFPNEFLGRFRALNPVTGKGRRSYTLGGNGNEFVPGFALFNFAPYNYFQRPDERYTFGTFAEYEIAPGAKPYLEAMFMDDTSQAQIAPSGDFGNTSRLNCDNPLLSAQDQTFSDAGKVALWTKADSVTYFDTISITPLK